MVRATKALLQAAAEAIQPSKPRRLPKGSKSSSGSDGVKVQKSRGRPTKSVTAADVVQPETAAEDAHSETAAKIGKVPKRRWPRLDPPLKTRAPTIRRPKPLASPWSPSDDLETKHRSVFHEEHIKTKDPHPSKDHLSTRADVASEQLCDDILKYLAPTLEPYKGCTIIDINPGACLWSSKLHDFLKPKRHILMEPQEAYMEPFIRPLLEASGSTYRHTDMHGAHPKTYWPNYVQLLSDDKLMPRRPSRAADDPLAGEIDHSLLVTGNLVRRFQGFNTFKKVRFAELALQHMTWSGLARDLFHNRGPVRMLWWCSEYVKAHVMAKNMSATSTYNVAMSVCASVTPVVECPPEPFLKLKSGPGIALARQETPSMVEESSKRLRASMENLGMRPPAHRAVFSPKASALDGRPGFKTPYTFDCQDIEKLTAAVASTEKVWQRFRAVNAMRYGPREVEYALMVVELQYPQLEGIVEAAAKFAGTQNYYRTLSGRRRAMLYSDIFLTVIHLEVNYKQLEEQLTAKLKSTASDGKPSIPEDLQALRERILSLGEDVHNNSESIFAHYQAVVEDQLAMFADPPRGIFNKRAYPSLQASTLDFLPQKPMTLLDVVPRTVDYTVPGIASRGEVCATTQELLKSIFAQRGHSLLKVLEQIAPNASHDLAPFLPTLHDPRKGGRLNPHRVLVRQITDEMVDELMQAWFEWPFRPPHGAIAGGSSGEGELTSLAVKGGLNLEGEYDEDI